MTDQLPVYESDVEKYGPASTPTTNNTMHTAASIHKEHHKGHGDLIRDSIIGFSDGLTVPFALTAGLSSLGSTKIVILGGLAELFAGSISMGLGAFLASVTDRKHYEVEEAREWREVTEQPQDEEDEIYEIFQKYGIQRDESRGVVEVLKANEAMWVQVRTSSLTTSKAIVPAVNVSLVHDGFRTPAAKAHVEEILH